MIPQVYGLTYSEYYNHYIDDDGERQIQAEERLASYLSDPEINQQRNGTYHNLYEFLNIIEIVMNVFGIAFIHRKDLRSVIILVESVLATWEDIIYPHVYPDEEQAAQMGRDLILLVLSILMSHWVTRTPYEETR